MNRVYKPVLFSIASLQILAMVAISTVLPQIAREYPDVDPVYIKSLVTLPFYDRVVGVAQYPEAEKKPSCILQA